LAGASGPPPAITWISPLAGGALADPLGAIDPDGEGLAPDADGLGEGPVVDAVGFAPRVAVGGTVALAGALEVAPAVDAVGVDVAVEQPINSTTKTAIQPDFCFMYLLGGATAWGDGNKNHPSRIKGRPRNVIAG
jgi:hypothetical protein